MSRKTNLSSLLPPFMMPYEEPVAALKAEDPEFNLIWDETNKILYNHFISTADEYGISRFEKMLNIFPKANDTLEVRRLRVQNRWFNSVPYTVRTLTLKIADLLGTRYSFSIHLNAYELTLTVYATNDVQVSELKYLLSVIFPANIAINIIYESVIEGTTYYGGCIQDVDIISIKQRR